MIIRYGTREIDWLGVLGFVLVTAATAAMILLMGRPL